MPIRFFNTYSRQLENFESRDAASRKVDIYTCGPTVYSRAHIGNFRAYVFEDLLQRHLELRGFKVHRVMNITDVDDKTIRGALEAKVQLSKFTEPFKQAFFQDIGTLRIKRADEFPAATDQRYIDKMIEMIGALITRGLAYQAEDKSVYYRIKKFPDYGKLSHIDLTQLQSTGRVKNDEYDKEHIGDFALWKAWDEKDGDVKWDSPWGPGRPGWHIECSAMATAILGDQIDIHCGGVDNIFPHHEAEIAQTEGVTGKQFVCYWLHCAHLLVDGVKMSKSLGNFYTLPDVTAKGYSGREIRYALMRVHYRTQLNFTWEGMEESRQALARIDDWLERLREAAAGKIDNGAGGSRATSTGKARVDEPGGESINSPGEEFEKALDDDLNISAALGFLFDSIREINRALDQNKLGTAAAKAWLDWWERINRLLEIEPEGASLPGDIAALAEARMQARLAKDWRKSDELRDELSERGWQARDTKEGQRITRRAGA
jgi:cysteinyl-tRNA synthetase